MEVSPGNFTAHFCIFFGATTNLPSSQENMLSSETIHGMDSNCNIQMISILLPAPFPLQFYLPIWPQIENWAQFSLLFTNQIIS